MSLTLLGSAALLVGGASDVGRAAVQPLRSHTVTHALASDHAALELFPANTRLAGKFDTEADLYVPAGMQIAKVVLFIPTGYGVDLTKAPGTSVGGVVALQRTGNVAEGHLGEIVAGDPTAYTTNAYGLGAHAAVWILRDIDDLPDVPVFVDPTSGPDAALGAYKAEACFPAPVQGASR